MNVLPLSYTDAVKARELVVCSVPSFCEHRTRKRYIKSSIASSVNGKAVDREHISGCYSVTCNFTFTIQQDLSRVSVNNAQSIDSLSHIVDTRAENRMKETRHDRKSMGIKLKPYSLLYHRTDATQFNFTDFSLSLYTYASTYNAQIIGFFIIRLEI